MRILAVCALVIAALSFDAKEASAQGKYWPWCARYDGWSVVCGFATFQQCLATVHGVGGFCQANVAPPSVAQAATHRRARHAGRARHRT